MIITIKLFVNSVMYMLHDNQNVHNINTDIDIRVIIVQLNMKNLKIIYVYNV